MEKYWVILKEQTGDTVLMVLLRSQILNGTRCHRAKVKITEMNSIALVNSFSCQQLGKPEERIC